MQYLLTKEELDELRAKAHPEDAIVKERLQQFYKCVAAALESDGYRHVIRYERLKQILDAARAESN